MKEWSGGDEHPCSVGSLSQAAAALLPEGCLQLLLLAHSLLWPPAAHKTIRLEANPMKMLVFSQIRKLECSSASRRKRVGKHLSLRVGKERG